MSNIVYNLSVNELTQAKIKELLTKHNYELITINGKNYGGRQKFYSYLKTLGDEMAKSGWFDNK